MQRILDHPQLSVQCVFTHARQAKFEDPEQPVRPELSDFEHLACARGIPLHAIDRPSEGKEMRALREFGDFDFLISLSWRYLVPPAVLERPKIASINLHRGKLPEYAGAFPVRRALEDRCASVTVTAHVMVEEVDAGEILAEEKWPAHLQSGESISKAEERLKIEIIPLYPLALFSAIDRCLLRQGLQPLRIVQAPQ